jgi:hypothetical protein
MNWKPITEPPQDGRIVLLWCGHFEIGYLANRTGWFYRPSMSRISPQPSHWKPLPEPPEPKKPTP